MASQSETFSLQTHRRGLTQSEAAAFAGITLSLYRSACERGDYPPPTLAGGRIDRKLLERHMDQLSGIASGEPVDALEAWERRRAARKA